MKKVLISILSAVISAVTVKLTQHFLDKGYEKSQSKRPPKRKDKIDDKETLISVVSWSIISSVVAGILKILTMQLTRNALPGSLKDEL